MLSPQGLRIFGSGGHAESVMSQLIADGVQVLGVHDVNPLNLEVLGMNVTEVPEQLNGETFVVAIGDNYARYITAMMLISKFGSECLGTYVSKSSIVAPRVIVPRGSVILTGAYVGPNAHLGEGVLLNTNAIVEHGCYLGNYSSIAPGGILVGKAKIGDFSAVGVAATVDACVVVGMHSLIGANSFCNKDVGDFTVAYGSPAKKIRKRGIGETYL